jgi:diguanylate cyclase (GGDEF)-like protein
MMSSEPGPRPRILVADDSKLMRKAAQKMLGEEFDVVLAEDGQQAWEQIGADASIQVVFTDLGMPRLDGYELLARVRSSEDALIQSLPLIVVTGAQDDEAARVQALAMGATDFITKPFTSLDLVARARAHANNQRITRQLLAQATLDTLTGLANKSGFMDRLQQDLAYARRHQQPLSLVRLEITDFRRLFLYHGRALSEAIELQVARHLRARIRKEDTAGRIGLGSFALSLPGGVAVGIEGLIERLRQELAAEPLRAEDGTIVAVELASAVLTPDLSDSPSAQAVMQQCQARLDAPSPAVAKAGAPVPVAPELPPQAATVSAPVLIDPLLAALAAGDSRAAKEQLPQAVGRLLPLLRLLGPRQRAQLVQFLQKLG